MASSFLLTPPGTGAIGVVRVVGTDAAALLERVFQPKDRTSRLSNLGDRLRYGWIVEDGERIDDVVLSSIDVNGRAAIDISMHGGIRVVERVLDLLDRCGAPLADADATTQPFWPAASCVERDAVTALSDAKTERAVRFLAWQRRNLAEALRQVAAICDSRPEEAAALLESMVLRSSAANVLLKGALVAIIGPPNVGKSTLFNALVGRSAAVVSDEAGTTRDWVSESVEMSGVPLTLVDTAGRRIDAGTLEQLAIAGGSGITGKAALRLVMVDATSPPTDPAGVCSELDPPGKGILLINKVDLGTKWDVSSLHAKLGPTVPSLRISSRSMASLAALSEMMLDHLGFANWEDEAPAFFAERQLAVARAALSALEKRPETAAALIARGLLGPL